MRSCPRCHRQFPDGTERCPADGTALVSASPPVAPLEPTEVLPQPPAFPPAISEVTQRETAPNLMAPEPRRVPAAAAPPAAPPQPRERTADVAPPVAPAGGVPAGRAAGRAGARGQDSSLAHGTDPTTPQDRKPRATAKPQESVGRVLGNYRLLELIGRGGMGWVYRAEHIKLGREVALKLLRPEYSARRDSVGRFFQEARAVNRIRHRNIVDATDFIELDDGTTFIIMELLRGVSLTRLAQQPNALLLHRALGILIQICDALGAAHAVGIVHRDMKPDNVIVLDPGDGTDLVKLLDFGVAKLLHAHEQDLGWQTKAGAVIGTPAFMSPEQAGALKVDGRSDVYSIGAIMYEMFCGQPLFQAASFGDYVRKHLSERPIPPRQTPGGRNMSEALEAIILRCLEKRPEDRYQSAHALRDDLVRLLDAFDDDVTTAAPSAVHRSTLSGPHRHPPAARTSAAPASRIALEPRPRGAGQEASGEAPSATPDPLPASTPAAPEAPRAAATAPSPATAAPAPALSAGFDRFATPPAPHALPRPKAPGAPTPASSRTHRMAAAATSSRLPLYLGSAALLGAAAGLVFFLTSRGRAAEAPAIPPAPVAIDNRTASGAQGPIITAMGPVIHVTSDPSDAEVFAAGSRTPLCRTPCDIALPASSKDARVTYVVRRSGFIPTEFEIVPGGNVQSMHIPLRALPIIDGDP
jgi:serine/threonine-protein kinase